MKFSGKMSFKIILKVTKSQGSTLSLGDTFFEKSQRGDQIDPPLRPLPGHFRVKNTFNTEHILAITSAFLDAGLKRGVY